MKNKWLEDFDPTGYSNQAKVLQDCLRAGNFVEALAISKRTLKRDPSFIPALLGISLIAQLSDENDAPELELGHARRALEVASELAALGGEADHEFARFLFALEDDPEGAIGVIETGMARRETELRDLEIALIEALVDVGRLEEAKSRLFEAEKKFPRSKRLKGLQADLSGN